MLYSHFANLFAFWQHFFLSIAFVKKSVSHIGHKIKRIRAYKGLKQEDLAKKIGKTRSMVSYFERTGIVNKYTLVEIAEALSVDVEKLEHADLNSIGNLVEENKSEIAIKDNCKETIERQKAEIIFLKETINHQWKLLQELAKKR